MPQQEINAEFTNATIKRRGVSESFPQASDLLKLRSLLQFSDRYEIAIYFWPNGTDVYIHKDAVHLNHFAGNFNSAISEAIGYLTRINNTNS